MKGHKAKLLVAKHGVFLKISRIAFHLRKIKYFRAFIYFIIVKLRGPFTPIVPLLPEFENDVSKVSELISFGDFHNAEILCNAILTKCPHHANVCYLLGYIYQQTSRLNQAIPLLKIACQMRPENFEYHNRLGCIYLGQKKYSLAKLEFQKSLLIYPNYSDSNLNMAYVCEALNQRQTAIFHFQKFLILNPKNETAAKKLVQLYFESRQEKLALAAYKNYISSEEEVKVYKAMSISDWCLTQDCDFKVLAPAEKVKILAPHVIGDHCTIATGSFHSNSLTISEVKNVQTFSSDNLVLTENIMLSDLLTHPRGHIVSLTPSSLVVAHKNKKLLIKKTNHPVLSAKNGIMMFGTFSSAYGHWLFEYLPRLMYFNIYDRYLDYPIYVDAGMPTSHYEMLEIINQGKREVKIVEPNTSVLFERLVILSNLTFSPPEYRIGKIPTNEDGAISPLAIEFLQNELSPKLKENKGCNRRIFLSRKNSKWRRLLNEDDVWQLLKTYHFESHQLEKLPFKDQASLMSDSAFVIGPSGSAINNILFCQPKTKVLILSPPNLSNYVSWASVMRKFNVEITFFCGRASTLENYSSKHSDYSVNLERLKTYLDKFL